MVTSKHGTTTLHEFESTYELMQLLSTAENNTVFTGNTCSSTAINSDRDSFTKTHTFKEAADLLANGWSPAAERLEHRLNNTPTPSALKKAVSAYDFAGQTACVPRYLNGMPDSMINRKMVVRKAPVVDVYRNIAYSAIVSASDMENEGLYTLQLVRELEKKGVRVKLHVYCATGFSHQMEGITLTIKQPDERMNISKIAFPLAHPSMYRRIIFKWIETSKTVTSRDFAYGYGYPNTTSFTALIKSMKPNAHFSVGKSQRELENELSNILGSAK